MVLDRSHNLVLPPIPGRRIGSILRCVDVLPSGAVLTLLESKQFAELSLRPIGEFVVSDLMADVVPLLMSFNLSLHLVEQT